MVKEKPSPIFRMNTSLRIGGFTMLSKELVLFVRVRQTDFAGTITNQNMNLLVAW